MNEYFGSLDVEDAFFVKIIKIQEKVNNGSTYYIYDFMNKEGKFGYFFIPDMINKNPASFLMKDDCFCFHGRIVLHDEYRGVPKTKFYYKKMLYCLGSKVRPMKMPDKYYWSQKMRNDVWEISFTKNNGEKRSMKCTRDPKLIPNEHNKSNNMIGSKNEYLNPNSDVVPVWDLEKKAWRSFKTSSLNGTPQRIIVSED